MPEHQTPCACPPRGARPERGYLRGAFAGPAAALIGVAGAHIGCVVAAVSAAAAPWVGAAANAGVEAPGRLVFAFSASVSAAAVGWWAKKRWNAAGKIEKALTVGLAAAGLAFSGYQNLREKPAMDMDNMPADCPMHRNMKPQTR